jgi:hypothetical protein
VKPSTSLPQGHPMKIVVIALAPPVWLAGQDGVRP